MNPPAPIQRQAVSIIALSGFMGAGKSTAGRALAAHLGWDFCDLDCEIEQREQCTIGDIFRRLGEARFRDIETEVLRAVLENSSGRLVIALGGGTPVQPRNADLLRNASACLAFLELDIEQLFQRCQAGEAPLTENARPLASDRGAFGRLYAERLTFYRGADLIVNTSDRTVEQVVAEIVSALRLKHPQFNL